MTQKVCIICVNTMGKHAKSVDTMVLERINAQLPGGVFTPQDFKDLGSRNAVASALKRYRRTGAIRQITRGLYDIPRTDPKLGVLSPSLEGVVEALKKRDAIRLQPTGAYAANLLGLSEQVPLRVVFLTDGPARQLKIGNLQVMLRHTTPRNMATAGTASGLVIQALRWLGRSHVDQQMMRRLHQRLRMEDRRRLSDDARYAPVWIAEMMKQIARIENGST